MIAICLNRLFLIQYWCRTHKLPSNIHYVRSCHGLMEHRIHNHLFPTNSSFVQYYVIFSKIWFLDVSNDERKSFTVLMIISDYDILECRIFSSSCERWTHHITRHETFNVFTILRQSLQDDHTRDFIIDFFLHSLVEAPVDTTRRIAATHNCNKRCPKWSMLPVNIG